MPHRCQAIKKNGQPCRRYVKAGHDYCYDHHPDRKICAQPGCAKTALPGHSHCQFHRKDGVTPTGFAPGHKTNRLNPKICKTGFNTQPLTPNKLVDTIIRLEMLLEYADQVDDYHEYYKAAIRLRQLQYRLNRALENTDLNAREIEQLIATEKAKARERLQAEFAAHQNLTTPQNTLRSTRYHQILDYIKNYINRNHQSPLLDEIAQALECSSKTARHHIEQLIKDQKLHKIPGNRSHGRFLRLGPPPGHQLPLF